MNPVFRTRVDALFEKLAWPFAPQDVAAQARQAGRHGVAREIESGLRTVDTAKGVGRAALAGGQLAGRGLSWALKPAYSEGRALANELSTAVSSQKPRQLLGAAALLAGAPIVMNAFSDAQKRREDELMNLQANPLRGFDKLSVDRFLEKKAQMRSHWMARAQGDIAGAIRDNLASSLVKSVSDAAVGGMGALAKKIHNSFVLDPKRKQLFESVVRSDPVISDAVERNPTAAKSLIEAYETMTRFAPSLTLDVNAVRSFLREAVIGGAAGVNYATIKSLIETERALKSPGDRK